MNLEYLHQTDRLTTGHSEYTMLIRQNSNDLRGIRDITHRLTCFYFNHGNADFHEGGRGIIYCLKVQILMAT